MSNESNSYGSGIGFPGLMFLIFMTLKLCNIITWSWWWVTAPLWITFIIFIIISVIVFIVAVKNS